MPRNGGGTYTLAQPPFTPGTTISSAAVNSDFSDIAAALTASIAADGQTPIIGQLKFPAGSAAAPSHTFEVDLATGMYFPATSKLGFAIDGALTVLFDATSLGVGQNGNFLYLNGAVACPVGMVEDYAGNAAPTGWFLCFGQAVSRTLYPELFTVIGTTFGSGDGVTTFNLPDLRGRVVAGLDGMGGVAAGRLTNQTIHPNALLMGSTGGLEFFGILQTDLPNVVVNVNVSLNDPGHVHAGGQAGAIDGKVGGLSAGSAAGNIWFGNPISTSSQTTGITVTSAQTNSLNGGVSQTSIFFVQPTMVMNKMIYAGRA